MGQKAILFCIVLCSAGQNIFTHSFLGAFLSIHQKSCVPFSQSIKKAVASKQDAQKMMKMNG
jgi:hypothetical protein